MANSVFAPEPHAPEYWDDPIGQDAATQTIADRLMDNDTCLTGDRTGRCYDFDLVTQISMSNDISLKDAARQIAEEIWELVYEYEKQGD